MTWTDDRRRPLITPGDQAGDRSGDAPLPLGGSGDVVDLNSERLRRRGHLDTGLCSCGRYRVQCREGCLEEAKKRHPTAARKTYSAVELLRRLKESK